jgi:hypothetical protein
LGRLGAELDRTHQADRRTMCDGQEAAAFEKPWRDQVLPAGIVWSRYLQSELG